MTYWRVTTLPRRLKSFSLEKFKQRIHFMCGKSNRASWWKTLRLTFIINRTFKETCLIFLLFGCSGCFPNCDREGGEIRNHSLSPQPSHTVSELVCICLDEKDVYEWGVKRKKRETEWKTRRGCCCVRVFTLFSWKAGFQVFIQINGKKRVGESLIVTGNVFSSA